MKKLSLILILAVSVFIAGTAMVQAVESSSGGISEYINNFYKTAIILGGVAAILVIIVGGLMWTTSGAIDQKNRGRDLITSAIWGLVLLLGAFIILNTVNPELTDLSEPGGVGEGIAGLDTGGLVTGNPGEDFSSCAIQTELSACPEGTTANDNLDQNGNPTCCNPVVECVGVKACAPYLTYELESYEAGNCDGEGYEGYEPGCSSGRGKCIKGILFKPLKCDGDLKPRCLATGAFKAEAVCVEKDDMEEKILVPNCKGNHTCEDNLETTDERIKLGGAWGRAAYYPENDINKAECVNYVYRKWSFTDWKFADLEGLKPCQ